jgi:ABC-2 type transport system permease protein
MEVPSYKKRAQAFPNTIPFSESIGFIMDIDDKDDVDMVYYITAHETAHQWWGHQINPAHVQGMGMISESLAQYSAIMALEQQYSKEASASALKLHLERYLSGRSQETVQEMPLSLVESGQQYIHYGKGLVNLYAFKDYVSEDSLNIALKRFITDWNSFTGVKKLQTDAYPTTRNLLRYFKEVTPDSLQYVIPDLFESITFHESSMIAVSYEQLDSNKYQVYLEFEVAKTKLDSLGKEHPSAINDWIDVGIYGQDPNQPIYLKKHRITNEQNGLKLIVNETPTAAGIDPLHLLIDRDGKNNVLPVQKKE